MGQVLDIGQLTLPAGYTPVEYIQNPGDAYIQTSLTGAMTWEITAQLDSETKNSGLVAYSTNDVGWYGTKYSVRQWLYCGLSSDEKAHIVVSFEDRLTHGTVSGVPFSCAGASIPTTNSFCLFNIPTNHVFPFYGKVFGRVKATDSGNNVVLDGFTCKNSSNIAGLYDTVSGTFFKSSTSTNFTAGPELPNNIAEKLQYIYNNADDIRDAMQECYSGFGVESFDALQNDVRSMNVNSTLDEIIFGSNT